MAAKKPLTFDLKSTTARLRDKLAARETERDERRINEVVIDGKKIPIMLAAVQVSRGNKLAREESGESQVQKDLRTLLSKMPVEKIAKKLDVLPVAIARWLAAANDPRHDVGWAIHAMAEKVRGNKVKSVSVADRVKDQVKTLRDKGYSVNEIANMVGVTTPAIYSWIEGRNIPRNSSGKRLMELATKA